MVDVKGQIGVEIAQRIIGKGRQVEDGFESAKVRDFNFADVLLDVRDVDHSLAECASAVQVAVHSRDLMPLFEEQGGQDSSDVAQVSGDEYSHENSSYPLCQFVFCNSVLC